MLVWFSAFPRLVLAESSLFSSLSGEPGRASVPPQNGKGSGTGILWSPVQISALPLTSCVTGKVGLLNATDPRFAPLAQCC